MKKEKMDYNEMLDSINDFKHDINHFEELAAMYQYMYMNYPLLTEEMADYIEGQLTRTHEQRKDSTKKLNEVYKKLYG